jgi:hypothetical protein
MKNRFICMQKLVWFQDGSKNDRTVSKVSSLTLVAAQQGHDSLVDGALGSTLFESAL